MKKVVWGVVVAVVVLAFASCASGPMVYDSSVAKEECFFLQISSSFLITEFDGKAVNWTGSEGLSFADKKVQIPAGHHTMKVGFNGLNGLIAGSIIDHFDDFEAGYTYQLNWNPDPALTPAQILSLGTSDDRFKGATVYILKK